MTKNKEARSPLSGAISQHIFSAKVLGCHTAEYFFDPQTKYIFVNEPHWLAEAYDDAISVTDTGILGRNLHNISIVEKLMLNAFPSDAKCIDLGGGYGIFVRGMRDRGFNFYWYDKYSQNLMARGFEAASRPYELAVAFEVLEHTINPLQFLQEQNQKFPYESLIFSATCFDPNEIPSKDWWYWSFESGQHISFFSQYTLEWIAQKMNLRLSFIGSDLYCMLPKNALEIKVDYRKPILERVLNRALRFVQKSEIGNNKSLTFEDHLAMVKALQENREERDT